MYIVAKYFTDLEDGNHPYDVGDTFPREGLEVTEERLAELAGTNNKRGEVLIKAVKGGVETPAETSEEKAQEEETAEPEEKPKETKKKATVEK